MPIGSVAAGYDLSFEFQVLTIECRPVAKFIHFLENFFSIFSLSNRHHISLTINKLW